MAESIQKYDKIQLNKRLKLRKPLIVLKVRLEANRRSFFGYAKNISAGGMFISSISPHNPGERFQVELPLPSPIDKQVQCTAEVVWQRKFQPGGPHEPGMGLRFLDLPDEVAQAIDDWVLSTIAPPRP